MRRYRVHDSGQMRGLGRVARQLTDVTPHGLELPAERLRQLSVVVEGQELVHQARDDVSAQRQAGGPVTILLPLKAGALQERLV